MYRLLVKPLLFLLSAETAHWLAFGLLRGLTALPGARALLRRVLGLRDPALVVRAFGLEFPGPVLLAAGFDKNAHGVEALGALGFGGVEIGTVTAEAQPGNPAPRLFRLPLDRALVNRMGFNNDGAAVVARRLARPRKTLVGVNIGKTKLAPEDRAIADYVKSAEALGALADYFVVNVSSPNTPGLRDLQSVEKLRPLLLAVREALGRARPARPPALLVKIAPDLPDDDVDKIGDLALDLGLDGVIATNTTVLRGGLASDPARVAAIGAGGLSGAPLKPRALEVLRRLRRRVGDKVVLVASGGIETADDAWERIRAGASLVQIYTAFVYEGPLFPRRLATEILARARKAGFADVRTAVGSAAPP